MQPLCTSVHPIAIGCNVVFKCTKHKTMLCLLGGVGVGSFDLTADAARQCPPCERPRGHSPQAGPGPGHRHGVAGGRPSIPRAPGWRQPGVTRTAPSTDARWHGPAPLENALPACMASSTICSVSLLSIMGTTGTTRCTYCAVHTYCAGRAIVPPDCYGRQNAAVACSALGCIRPYSAPQPCAARASATGCA